MGLSSLACFALAALAGVAPQEPAFSFEEGFQDALVGDDGSLVSQVGRFVVEGERPFEVVHPPGWGDGDLALRLPGGVEMTTVLEVAPGASLGGTLEFVCQRDGRRQPFALSVLLMDRDGGETVHHLESQVNGKERRVIMLAAPPGLSTVRFRVTAPAARGVWIDDVRFAPPRLMEVTSVQFERSTRPLIQGESVEVGHLEILTTGTLDPLELEPPTLSEIRGHGGSGLGNGAPDEEERLVQAFTVEAPRTSEGRIRLATGRSRFLITATVGAGSTEPRWSRSTAFSLECGLGDRIVNLVPDESALARAPWPAVRITSSSADATSVSLVSLPTRLDEPEVLVCLVTIQPGGLSLFRSLNGGATWEPAVLPDGYADLRGGSSILDLATRELHLLAEGERSLQTATSTDAGVTWTEWRPVGDLGPKRIGAAGSTGITLSTGALALPVIVYGGFRIEGEACAGLLVSEDHGASWAMHQAAYPNTTTSAVVELGPRALLLSMTDGRGALRSERTSRDLGKSWNRRRALAATELHRSAGSDGALLHLGRARGLGWDSRLVFANAATSKLPLRDLMLKGSSDNASHWPAEHHVMLDDGIGVNHPSLCPVGRVDVGVAYECSAGGVVFQRIPESVAVPRVASWFDLPGGK